METKKNSPPRGNIAHRSMRLRSRSHTDFLTDHLPWVSTRASDNLISCSLIGNMRVWISTAISEVRVNAMFTMCANILEQEQVNKELNMLLRKSSMGPEQE